MRRRLLGLTAIASFLLSAACFWWLGGENGTAYGEGCLRAGVMLSVVWLAFDQLERLPGWLLAAAPAMLLVLVFRPKWFFFLLPLVLLIVILRPRHRRG